MGGRCRLGNVFATAGARKNAIGFDQLIQLSSVKIFSLRLHIRSMVAADIRPFFPINSQPAQIIDRLLARPRFHTRRIDVFDAHQQVCTTTARRPVGQKISPRVTQVLCSGRRWGKSAFGHFAGANLVANGELVHQELVQQLCSALLAT